MAIALSSTIFTGLINVTINFCKDIKSLVLLWWSGVGSLVVGLISSTFDKECRIFSPQNADISYVTWLTYFGIAIAGIIAYFFMTKALQMIDPTVVAFVRALEIVLEYTIQVSFMHQVPGVLSIVGALLVMISVFGMAFQEKIVSTLPERIRLIM